jgi:hypothetical protein
VRQVEDLSRIGSYYITAVTKSQIETLFEAGIVEKGLFDSAGRRALRAAAECSACRTRSGFARRISKLGLHDFAEDRNRYQTGHPRARVNTAEKTVPGWYAIENRGLVATRTARAFLAADREPIGALRGFLTRWLLRDQDRSPRERRFQAGGRCRLQGFGESRTIVSHVQEEAPGDRPTYGRPRSTPAVTFWC